jgi:Ni/Co efflux regulator RcnB
MKRFLMPVLALSMAVGAAGAASAQPYGHDRYDGRDRYSDHGGYGHWRHEHDRSDWRRGGYVARDDWGRGDVIDYRRHHLRRPPYGYQWREIDGRYVLAAVASGIIADVIFNAR